jgi:hypothetical protein
MSNVNTVAELSDLSFFEKKGLKNLLLAMFKQSIKDLITDRASKHAPAEIRTSALWLNTPAGRDCIQFLMPSASPDQVCAKVYADPQAVLQAMDRGEFTLHGANANGLEQIASHSYTLPSTDAVQNAVNMADSDDSESEDGDSEDGESPPIDHGQVNAWG